MTKEEEKQMETEEENEFEVAVEETTESDELEEEIDDIEDDEIEDDGIDEALGLKRHPHAETDEEELEEDEDQEESDEEETESTDEAEPEKEKSVYEQADEEFMESIEEKPRKQLTPEQAKNRQKDLLEIIAKSSERVTQLEPIINITNTSGLGNLIEEIKSRLHDSVDDEKLKDISDWKKVLEAVLLTQRTIESFRSECNGKKREIKTWGSEYETLQCPQLSLLDCVPAKAEAAPAELTEEEKVELAENAEPCQEDCTICEEECANQPDNDDEVESVQDETEAVAEEQSEDDGSDVLDAAIEEAVSSSAIEEEEEIA